MNDNNEFVNPIDALLDEENNEDIVLFNEKGEPVSFEQIAIIPRNNETYAILKPVIPFPEMDPDEGLVFRIANLDEENEGLELVVDEQIIDEVFAVYDELVAEEYGDEE